MHPVKCYEMLLITCSQLRNTSSTYKLYFSLIGNYRKRIQERFNFNHKTKKASFLIATVTKFSFNLLKLEHIYQFMLRQKKQICLKCSYLHGFYTQIMKNQTVICYKNCYRKNSAKCHSKI